LPDITLAPALASYFGVSMDILFDFNLQEMEDKAIAIALKIIDLSKDEAIK